MTETARRVGALAAKRAFMHIHTSRNWKTSALSSSPTTCPLSASSDLASGDVSNRSAYINSDATTELPRYVEETGHWFNRKIAIKPLSMQPGCAFDTKAGDAESRETLEHAPRMLVVNRAGRLERSYAAYYSSTTNQGDQMAGLA